MRQYSFTILVAVIGLIALLHLISSWLPIRWAWGFNFLSYLPAWFSWSAVLITVAVFIAPVNQLIQRWLVKLNRPLIARHLGQPVILAAALLVFVLGRNSTHFLGDGYLWLRTLPEGYPPYASEIMNLFVHRAVYLLAHGPFDLTPLTAYRITSTAAGILTVLYVVKASRILAPNIGGQALTAVLTLSSGFMLLGFGYVEHYPLMMAAFVFFIYRLLEFDRSRYRPLVPALALGISSAFHLISLAGWPALVYQYGRRIGFRSWRCWLYSVLPILVWAVIFAGIMIIEAKPFGPAFKTYHLLPLFSSLPAQEAILTPGHLVDLANLYLLIGPFGMIVLVLGLISFARKTDFKNSTFVTLALISTAFMLFTVAFNADKGPARDWDLFAVATVPWSLLGCLLLTRISKPRLSYLTVIAGFVALLHTVPWVIVNANRSQSLDRFHQLMTVNPDRTGSAHEELAIYYRERRMYDAAEQEHIAATRVVPTNSRYWAQLGHLYDLTLEPDKAVTAYQKAVALDPHKPEEYVNLGNAHRRAGRYRAGIEVYRQATAIDSLLWQAWFNVGLAFTDLGQPDSAVPAYRLVLKINPNSAEADFNIGTILASRRADQEALPYLEAAARLQPDNAAAQYNLGITRYNVGHYEEAVRAYHSALKIDPKQAHVHNNLGMTYEKMGEFARAEQHYREALSLEPGLLNAWNNLQRLKSVR